MPHELLLGWLTHYGVGIAFAGLLVLVQGRAWLQAPAVLPAVLVGAATVLMPLAVMQPAMGLGFAASKTPHPTRTACAAWPTTRCSGWASASLRPCWQAPA